MFESTIKKVDIKVDRMVRGEGTFAMIRFRNKNDLNTFADLLDLPQLKAMKSGESRKLKWSANKEAADPFSQFE